MANTEIFFLTQARCFFMKDDVDFYKLNINPLLIEKEEYQITGEYLDLWIPNYEIIKDLDFAALE